VVVGGPVFVGCYGGKCGWCTSCDDRAEGTSCEGDRTGSDSRCSASTFVRQQCCSLGSMWCRAYLPSPADSDGDAHLSSLTPPPDMERCRVKSGVDASCSPAGVERTEWRCAGRPPLLSNTCIKISVPSDKFTARCAQPFHP
jgi:hypothetical protein